MTAKPQRYCEDHCQLGELADEIERLERRVAAARKILEPMHDCDPDIREWLGLPRWGTYPNPRPADETSDQGPAAKMLRGAVTPDECRHDRLHHQYPPDPNTYCAVCGAAVNGSNV